MGSYMDVYIQPLIHSRKAEVELPSRPALLPLSGNSGGPITGSGSRGCLEVSLSKRFASIRCKLIKVPAILNHIKLTIVWESQETASVSGNHEQRACHRLNYGPID